MKKMRSLLCALTALAMLLAAIPALGEVAGDETFLAKEPVKVSVAYFNFVDPTGNEIGERIHQKILDDFRIDLQIVPITPSDFTQKLSMLAASDDLPDVCLSLGWDDKNTLKKYVDEGMIRSIPEEMYSKYEHVNTIMTKYNYEAMPDGQLYILPREDYCNTTTGGGPFGFFYRKDYAEKLGYDNEKLASADWTIEEFTEFLRAMANNDPDGNGNKDTYALSNAIDDGYGVGSFREIIYPMFGWRDWVYEDGAWKFGFLSSAAKTATKWLNQMYTEGVIDPEFALTTDTTIREKFSNGTIGVCVYNMNTSNAYLLRTVQWEAINPDLPVEDYVGFLPVPKMDDGARNTRPKTYWSATVISSKVDDDKLDRILRMYDWLYSAEGYIYATWGEEGVDYTVNNGVYESLLKDNQGAGAKFCNLGTFQMLQSLAAWHLDGIPDAIDPAYKQWDSDADAYLRTNYWTYNWSGDQNFPKYMFSEAISELSSTLIEDELVNLIMKSTDFDADWDAMVERVYAEHNLAAVEAEVNAGAAERGVVWDPYK